MPALESDRTRVLVLGGSSEATRLAAALADRRDVETILSLAGRTAEPASQPVTTRIGGFGGVAGLVAFLARERIDVLVDATHPFAEQMAANARDAARLSGVQFIKVGRDAWRPEPGDQWTEVDTMADVVDALGAEPKRVFLTIGRLRLAAFATAPQHHYVIRTIDPIGLDHGLPHVETLLRRGPFDVQDEERILRQHGIEILVTKNSGGDGAYPKVAAARNVGIPVVLLRRSQEARFVGVEEALSQISAHRPTAPRGV